MTLYEAMKNTAIKKGDADCIVFYGKRYSFLRVLELVDCVAAGLKKAGVKKGDVVTLCLPNTPSAQIAFYALNKVGAIVNLVHPKIPPIQLQGALKKTNSVMLIVYDLYLAGSKLDFMLDFDGAVLMSKCDFFMGLAAKTFFNFKNRKKKFPNVPVFEQLVHNAPENESAEFGENEPAAYLPSGGTTGSPKIVMHSNKAFLTLCGHAQFFLSEEIANYSAMYTVLPIFHGFGLCMNMMMCAQYGLKNVMSTKFDTKHIAKSVKKEGVNIIMGVPSMFNKLIKCKYFNKADLSSIKDCFVGGDSVPTGTVIQFNDILHRQGSGGRLHVGYGLTETIAVCTVNNAKISRENSVGTAMPDCGIKIFSKDLQPLKTGEVGEIGVNGPVMTLGYLDETTPIKNINGEEWLLTGDLGYVDLDGFLYFKQRAKNMLKVSGVPVFPSEVEEVAQRINGVARAAAIGVKDANSGEAVKLFVEVPAINNTNLEKLRQEILDKCAQSLICYAVPKYIEFKESLPLNDIGKVDASKLS